MATNPKNFAIERNSFPRRDCDIARLPFVQDVKVGPRRTERKFWCVPEVDCYGEANAIGAQYAADWLQYLRDNPGVAGDALMGRFANEMYQGDREKRGGSHGVAVGFWTLIEQALSHAGTFDHYAAAEAMAQRYAQYSAEID